jgi:hypothetical protein
MVRVGIRGDITDGLFVTGPGPDAGGSNQGKAGCIQTPAKFGIEVAPFVSALADPSMVCSNAGVAVAAANAMNRTKFRCVRMPNPPFRSCCVSAPALT